MATVDNLRPFKPGESGNPGGRPRSMGRYIRQQLGEDGALAVNFLLRTFADPANPHKDRFQALELLLAYGWGRPPQGVAVTMVGDGTDDSPERRFVVEVVPVDYRQSIRGLNPHTAPDYRTCVEPALTGEESPPDQEAKVEQNVSPMGETPPAPASPQEPVAALPAPPPTPAPPAAPPPPPGLPPGVFLMPAQRPSGPLIMPTQVESHEVPEVPRFF